jgi:Ca2+-binding RTX toxin-like protein
LEQQELLLESATNAGGYFSQVLKSQGGFTIAAGVEIENATGSAFADSITGNFLPNVLIGRSGNDTIDGLQGDDVINGGGGDDELNGNFGADKILGGTGKNIFLSAEDGFTDTLVIKPDRDGDQNFDIIEGLDPFDIVLISDTGAEPLSARDISSDGLAGVGIFVGNNLEALYTGGTLTSQQIQDLTSFIA